MVSGFRHGADSVEFRRDDRGRIIGTTFPDGSTRTYAYDTSWVPDGTAAATADAHDTTDSKRVALAGREAVHVQPYYGSAVFDPETFAVAAFKPLRLVPGLEDALGLWDIAEPLLQFGPDAAAAFDKPSNPVFQPDEYRSTNCCLPCLPGVYLGCGCQLLETLLVVCGCLPAEPEPPVSEKDPTCAPCNPPVGRAMHKEHGEHPRGGNHGVAG